jgi:hypothetical protein
MQKAHLCTIRKDPKNNRTAVNVALEMQHLNRIGKLLCDGLVKETSVLDFT